MREIQAFLPAGSRRLAESEAGERAGDCEEEARDMHVPPRVYDRN